MNITQNNKFINQSIKEVELLEQTKSSFQTIEIFNHPFFGKMMMLDGEASIAQNCSFSYFETITHIGLCTKADVKDVLIIGGGNGGIANEVLKHKEVKSIDIVEIDELIPAISKKHFEFSKALEKASIFIQNGYDFIQEKEKNSYDIIIIDTPTLKEKDFDEAFFAQISKILTKDGIMILRSFDYDFEFLQYEQRMKQIRNYFRFVLPAYSKDLLSISGKTSLIYASKKHHPLANLLVQKIDMTEGLEFYNDEIHRASFAISNDLFKRLLRTMKI